MSIVTFIGGPFDGDMRVATDCKGVSADLGVVLRSDAVGAVKPRYCVYLPDGKGGMVFECYAPTLDAGLAMLPKENRR